MPRKTMTDMEKVAQVLTNASEYPATSPISARTMLADGLPHALAAGAEHDFQKEIAELTAAMLEEVRAAAEAALEATGAQAGEAEAQRDAAEVERVAAAERGEAAKAEVDAREAAQREAKAAVKANKALQKEAKQAESVILKEKAQLTGRKEQLDGLAAALKAFEEGQGEAPTDDVLAYLEEIGAEKALVAAVPGALGRKAEERGAFDSITLAEVGDLLSQSVTSVAAEIAEGAQAETFASAEALGAWAVLDVSEEKAMEAAANLATAQEAHEAAAACCAAADATLAERNAALSDTLVQKTLAEEKVSEIAQAAAALERLRNPPAPAPEPEVQAEAEAEAAPMEVEAEAKVEEGAPMDIAESKVEVSESKVATPSKVQEVEAGIDVSRIATPLRA